MQVPEHSRGEVRLHDWQSALQACIVDPQRDRKQVRAWLQAGSVGGDIQLDIYANAYVMRLIEALRCNYPAICRALGDEDFAVMAKRYLERHPSAQASIRWFGDSLPVFLQDREPYSLVPVLSELASLEWAIRHTIDAADADRLTVESLLSVPAETWGGLQFDLHPSVTRLSLQWNAPRLWHALTDDAESVSSGTVAPARQAMHWLIYRKPDLVTGWHSLTGTEKAALDRLQQGATFGDICEYIALHDDRDAAVQAAGLIRLWVEQGILIQH